VIEGALISYGVDLSWCFQRSGYFIDKILHGAPPGDLPIEFPTKFPLTINLKTAKELGITPPPLLLARADEVIEKQRRLPPLARLRHAAMSDLSQLCAAKRTFANVSGSMGSRPKLSR